MVSSVQGIVAFNDKDAYNTFVMRMIRNGWLNTRLNNLNFSDCLVSPDFSMFDNKIPMSVNFISNSGVKEMVNEIFKFKMFFSEETYLRLYSNDGAFLFIRI